MSEPEVAQPAEQPTEKGWVAYVNEAGETCYKMRVPRRTDDELRADVRGILENQLYPSVSVPPSLVGMVFMPVLLGALAPPDEVRDLVFGGLGPKPKEPLPPEAPKKPKLPEALPFPAEPTLVEVDPEMEFKERWSDISPDEMAAHRAEVAQKNAETQAKYEAELARVTKHNETLNRRATRVCREHAKKLKQHQAAYKNWETTQLAEYHQKLAAWEALNEKLYTGWVQDIGCLIGDMKNTFPRSINGYPMFHAYYVVHKDDWKRIAAAVNRELDRAKNLEV